MRITIVSLVLAVALGFGTAPALADKTAAKSTATIPADLNYLLSVPPAYETSREAFLLIVWLHGGDQGGSDVEKVRASELPAVVEGGKIQSTCDRMREVQPVHIRLPNFV